MKSPTEIKLPELIRRKTNEILIMCQKNKRQFMKTIGVCILVNRQQQPKKNKKKTQKTKQNKR